MKLELNGIFFFIVVVVIKNEIKKIDIPNNHNKLKLLK